MKDKNYFYLLVYCILLYLLFLGGVPLLDPDEPVYGETAKEMLATGDWLSPRIYGEFWYDKPPLFYWLEALSFSVFGTSTFTARLPSALIGMGTVLWLYKEAKALFPLKTAALGALIFASSLETVVLARSAVTDMSLTAALTVAMLGFLRKRYVLAYAACGIALLAKGPIGFGFPALIVAIWLMAQKKFTWKPIMGLRWYWGIPLACVVGLPWYLYMVSVHGAPFVDTFLGYHNLTRFAEPEHAGKDHWWLYFVVLAAGCFPWTGAAFGLWSRMKSWWKRPEELYLMVWVLFIFIFFSASSTQLFSYIFPLFPPLSLLAARYLTEDSVQKSRVFAGLHLFFGALVAAALALAPLSPEGGMAVKYGFPVLLFLLILSGALCWLKGYIFRFCFLQGAAALLLTFGVWTFYAPVVTEDFTSSYISAKVKETDLDPARTLYIDPFYRPNAAFYHDLYGKALPLPGKGNPPPAEPSYILVQKKVYEDWDEGERAAMKTVWETKTALFLTAN